MRKRILLGCLVFILCLCAGCGQKESHTDQGSEEETEPVSDAEPEDTTQAEEKEIQNEDTGNITISTSYIPIAHKKDALIVQRSEDIELYGVLDDTGATILEPEYDSLRFVFMNDQDYIAARLGDAFGILKPDGTEYIPLGEYDEIVSAGNIGWLAKKDGKQYLLGTDGEVTRALNGIYKCVAGNCYLYKVSESEANERMTSEMETSSGELYDLEENLVLSSDDIGVFRFTDVYDENVIDAVIKHEGGQQVSDVILDASGKIIITYGLEALDVVSKDIDLEENMLTVQKRGGEYHEYNLTTGEETVIELETGTERVHQILVKKSGDFYQLYTEDEQELIEGRYADYEKEDCAMFLENIDAQWGLIDYSGNIIIPFGEITQEELDFYFNGKQMHDIEEFSSEDLFGFYTEDQGLYIVHIFSVDPTNV